MHMPEEMIEIVDSDGNITGIAPRNEVHGNPALMHRVVHVLVFNSKDELLLQKRSMDKDVAPGKWDTSVGGHVDPGESLIDAAKREMKEELGISPKPVYLYTYVHSNDYETEQVHTYKCIYDGDVTFNPEEIDEVRSWGFMEVQQSIGTGLLSDNFEHEIRTFLNMMANANRETRAERYEKP